MKLNENYFNEIKEIEEKYFSLISEFNTNFPKILNLEEEKIKFFKAIADDAYYNPKFKFEKKEFNLKKFEELKNLKIDLKNDIYNIKKLYKQRLKSKIFEIDCHINWGNLISTRYVKLYRGAPNLFLLYKAKKYVKEFKREKVKFRKIDVKTVGKKLKLEVKKLTKNNIKIKYQQINSKVNIAPSQNLIKINPTQRFTSLDVKRLKVHEIGVHYMRYFNGKSTNIKIFESGTSNYIETEEGLAVYCEELKGVSSKAQMYIYAGRVIATYFSLKKSFYQVFMILKKMGFSDEIAFSLTVRSKRNLSDTSKKGGFTKDYVYFSGYLKVKKYVINNDIENLFLGKIKIEDLKLLKNYIRENKINIKTIFD